MFDHYLDHQRPDSRRRWRLLAAAHLAGVATAGFIGFTWLLGKMVVVQVSPPTTNYVMVQMSVEHLPPPPAPPAAPAVRSVEESRPPPEEDDSLVAPDNIIEELPAPRPRATKVVGNGAPNATGTIAFGGPSGIPGVIGGPPGIPNTGSIAVRQPTKPVDTRPPVPISTVRSQAIYAPAPDKAKLAATKAGMFDRRAGTNETAFCVGTDGRTVDVRTVKPFPNDPSVDQVCRDTIKTWRFKPFLVDGRPTRTCSIQEFRINFQ